MQEFQTILTGVDFSPGSAAALKHAMRMAADCGAKLVVFHAIPRLVITNLAEALSRGVGELEAEVLTDARKQLTEFIGTESVCDRVIAEVAVGTPLEETLDAVRRHNADLLILGVTGESGHRGGVGTFATKCVRQARTRVLLVHDSHSDDFRRIVACVDFSKTSERALAQAMRLARSNNSELTALHVYFGPWHRLHYRSPTPEALPAFQRQYLTRLQRLLDAVIESASAELGGVHCRAELYEHRSYGRGIVAYAQENNADLVVLGTEGNANLRYMFIGSTAERVLRETPCSVLTIKPLKYSRPKA